jgi:osmoprotectant transport system ATP-binding protein
MIEIRHVNKSLSGALVLKDISLRLAQSQTHVILGRSGSGKSTLLKILAGILKPDDGEVIVSHDSGTVEVGYVIQEGGLFPHLTARENVSLIGETHGWSRTRTDARLADLIELVELEPQTLEHFPFELSGGEQQRVGIVRALFLNPEILLLDEPLGSLDPVVRRMLQTGLKRIFNRLKKTVVIVTHDVSEAAYFGHTITLLEDGKILQHGHFEDFIHLPSTDFVTEFIYAQRPWNESRKAQAP